MNNKDKYRELCKVEPMIPIFSKDWWLDAVAGEENWDVVLIEKGDDIVASLPYVIKKKFFLRYISMPKLTQTAGIWMKYPDGQKYANKISFEREVCKEIIEKLPSVDAFSQNFHYSFTNWLPFYWEGFNQTTFYTYILENLKDHQKLFTQFKENIRREIRKAEKKVKVYNSDSIEDFFLMVKKTFDRQNQPIPYDLELLRKIDAACTKEKCRKIFFAADEGNQVHSAIFIIWDSQSAYYLMGGGDPELRNSGATSLLMWEAIKFSSTVTANFNFEGSMIQSIERFFSAFGAIQKPYFHISKTNSAVIKIHTAWKELLK
ncbi:GNAT family N-acetyltransferase [Bacillus sp. DTU_2020_1000418_1_SI_GHA_SEK_038]|uniref:GNAT family N-acetyltransferase n=1 Tax=Bacillus sp. DTU_2020_1000418_1_SI_GHA_SEK_038 TaxID=3077585 RepID=UPI0028EF6F0D|nr:GNAT family N-acetyltransferase [Bacillus sp. DTU_2020_1000418_1_SI_GHA_SEK_038]WNS74824.1 GNAT family N-acetyltransferase [Bacillus sp. DTU_2020_1000418_1_SI_GHA_SEK_038]